tara:strand:- start:380 stop:661 length:282 start_codon:yes stop_codon:yes gene_type:complete
MKEQPYKIKAKINRQDWINWRFSAAHEVEDLDYSSDIIESLAKTGKYEVSINIDEYFYDCGYLDTNFIENIEDFPDLEQDQEIDPCSVEVEWV